MVHYLGMDDTGSRARILVNETGTAGQTVKLTATGNLHASTLPDFASAGGVLVEVGAALSINRFVNLYEDGGVLKARPAVSGTSQREAHGISPAAYAIGAMAKIHTAPMYYGTARVAASGTDKGKPLYLTISSTGSPTAPTTTNNIVQLVGMQLANNDFMLQLQPAEVIL